MNKATVIFLMVMIAWFGLGISSRIPGEIFYTGLLAFVFGALLIDWDNNIRNSENKRSGGKK